MTTETHTGHSTLFASRWQRVRLWSAAVAEAIDYDPLQSHLIFIRSIINRRSGFQPRFIGQNTLVSRPESRLEAAPTTASIATL